MHQIAQNNRSGQLSVLDVPAPLVQAGHVLIANTASLISVGTERSMRQSAQLSLIERARRRPNQVRRVIKQMLQNGVISTYKSTTNILDQTTPLGYSSAGLVLACGHGVQEFKPGDRVASNGPHAGVVCVPRRLCARIPENVSFEHATFSVLSAIAMQGTRLARLDLGATALVIGLGLVGQLTVALLKASGVKVIGIDPDPTRCNLAKKMGADYTAIEASKSDLTALSNGLGMDAIIITASTPSQEPIKLAAEAVRKKGRIVLVGVVGLELDRSLFYAKECEFVVSCSYGPGRYDPDYEERGHDYPAAYVRWTEQRNIETALYLMSAGRLDVSPLISHRFPIEKALNAYELVEKQSESCMGIILQYDSELEIKPATAISLPVPDPPSPTGLAVAVLGAGNFARNTLLPAIIKAGGCNFHAVCSAKGLSAEHFKNKFRFAHVAADETQIFADPAVNAVFILTRHHQHADQAMQALMAGKHVFVEKPLCITLEELARFESLYASAHKNQPTPILMVGFNRRFSPAALQLHRFFKPVQQPLTVSIRFNAGAIPRESWIQNDEVGGGRIIGEACHALDLAVFLTQSLPVKIYAESIGKTMPDQISDDQCIITMRHANGSISSIIYTASGDPAYPKERVEVFGGGRVGVIDDFRILTTSVAGRNRVFKSKSQDKGHCAEIIAFRDAIIENRPPPISWPEIRAVTLASILAVQSIREGIAFEIT